jgi:two-component system, OmpR family, phosphate regulon sensor histidine kinase PhoR
MNWLVTGVGIAAVLIAIWLRVRRRWVEPWSELEELVTAIVSRKSPRKFLMTGNDRANVLGLALEKLADKQRELEVTATQGTNSLQSILGALPDGLVLVDHQRRIQVMNPQFRELFGLREDVAGIGLLEIVRDAVVDRAVAGALEHSELRTEPMTIARGLESKRELEVTAVPFTAGNNGTHNAVVLFRDITQVRQVEEMRRDFVANVSHELRTPLSIFRGYLETLLDDPVQPREELIRILEVMDRHADRLTLLVEDILSLAKLETPGARLDLTEIYLPEFLDGILRDWEKRFGTKLLSASLEASEDLPVISADEHRLQEVIYNLLDNAVKYSQPEGKIRLHAQRVDDSVRISVSDEGVGIPTRDLPRIFERFYRADKARSRQLGGTGLGLSIVKHIAQLHGGSVEAESEPGVGTTISIVLPVRPPIELEEAREIAQPQFHF